MGDFIVVILGPTAVGKTDISIEVAKALNGEIVSADSMQIYKYFNIGSAKPTKEEMGYIKHYLIDEIDPKEKFSVAEYEKLATKYIDEILSKNKIPIIVGGTGLYINSILYEMDFGNVESDSTFRNKLEHIAKDMGKDHLYGMLKELDPEAAKRIHPNNVKRVIRAIEIASASGKIKDFSKDLTVKDRYRPLLIGLLMDRNELYKRINTRVDIMFEKGLVSEVKNLLDLGLTEDDISMKGIGYKEVLGYLKGEYGLDEAIRLVKRNTRRYAKRQLTWFKRYENVKWFNVPTYISRDKLIDDIIHLIKGNMKLI